MEMKTLPKKYDIESIRTMLTQWYDGSISENDEQRLIEWFCNTPDAELPADMAADATIFRAMGDYKMPTDQEVSDAIDRAIVVARNRSRKIVFRRLSYFAGIGAAAACLIVLFNIGIPEQVSLDVNSQLSDTTNKFTEQIKEESDTITNIPDLLDKKIADNSVTQKVRKSETEDADYGYSEVSVEEARVIISNSLAMFDDAVRTSTTQVSHSVNQNVVLASHTLEKTVKCVAVSTGSAINKAEIIINSLK